MSQQEAVKKFRFAIDRGGTFTDVFAITPDDRIVTLKLLSENPQFYADAPTFAIKKIIAQETKTPFNDGLIDPSNIEWIRMGTTVATNALLEGKGDPFCLLITKGFRDLLFIGNQSRPNLFDLSVEKPPMLYADVIEVEERVVPHRKEYVHEPKKGNVAIKTLLNGQQIEVWNELNMEKLEADLVHLRDVKKIKNIAVLLVHSYLYHEHEVRIGELAASLGFTNISLSHRISSMIRAVPRGLTTAIDAYLTPCIQTYLNSFKSSFSSQINVLFMQSDGGLTSIDNFRGCKAILSGPAGGVVGYAVTSYDEQEKQAVIGFDMGGTSTDVSRYDGNYEHVFETLTAGYLVQTPQLDINTIAAGGGSMLFFRAGMFAVGPESASSNPGPACYKKDGPLTITDANLVLGRLVPDYFPHIFGKSQNEPLDYEASHRLFVSLTDRINAYQTSKHLPTMTLEQVALGFVRVANEAMCRPIRNLTEGKGYDTRKHLLACFGGAGGQHACAIARSLGIRAIRVNRYSGILSAYGLSLADVVHEEQEPCDLLLDEANMTGYMSARIEALSRATVDYLCEREHFEREQCSVQVFLNLRYADTDTGMMCQAADDVATGSGGGGGGVEAFLATFTRRYRDEYGFNLDRPVYVDDIRVRGIGKSRTTKSAQQNEQDRTGPLKSVDSRRVYFDRAYEDALVYRSEDMRVGDRVDGPALIIDKNSTILVEPSCHALIDANNGDMIIHVHYDDEQAKSDKQQQQQQLAASSSVLDTTQLSIFSHRFMSIAEQMGRILQRTSVSTNIKERLDYSCAMFDATGGLVANAPHIPVHLGAMQEAVKYQIEHALRTGEEMRPGDVLLANHPACGGSHLPDLTVITPVFNKERREPVFYVANRGHHADIGGLTPGSMPPNSTMLWQEGAVFKSLKIVKDNVFNEKEIVEALEAPSKYPHCSGTRNLSDNLSDLKAQIAANKKGIDLITQLIDEYSLGVVLAYMGHIQHTAEQSVRELMLNVVARANGRTHFEAVERMDDGSSLHLSVNVNTNDAGSATFDFEGTSYQVNGNCNAPKAITLSAIIYCLRCMLAYDIPLNQGCLRPIDVRIPRGSLLWPSEDAAVVGGNVLTSQRVVDVIFKAFGVCAASQGCMNNITFGNEKCGYYETVGGGAGAGPNWHGQHAVHTHMTNTRITDVEIMENRYPIVLNKFSRRSGSGGLGQFSGGDGLVREYIFRESMKLCVLTERRVFAPYGLNGGTDGSTGRNTLVIAPLQQPQQVTNSGNEKENPLPRNINMCSKSEANVKPGDMFRLETPGGGGYGSPLACSDADNNNNNNDDGEAATKFKTVQQKGSLNQYNALQESC